MNQNHPAKSNLFQVTLTLFILGCCVSFRPSLLQAEPAARSLAEERSLLVGTWTCVSYDFDGKADRKMKRNENLVLEFEVPQGAKDGNVYLILKFSGIKGLPFNHSAGVGLDCAYYWSLTQEASFSLATSDDGEKNRTPRFFIYRLQEETLDLMLALDGTESKSFMTQKGDGKAVFHLQRKQNAASGK